MARTTWWRWVAFLALVGALGLMAAPGWAQESGSLSGLVSNGTPDGPEPGAGLSVVLRVLEGGVEVESLSTTTDADGRYRFDGLDLAPELEYWPQVTYLDITYTSQAAYAFAEGTTELSAPLTVYETSADSSSLRADGMHLIVDRDPESGLVVITEIYLISNPGERTVIGREGLLEDRRVTVMIPAPENAQDLFFPQMGSEEDLYEMGSTLLDTQPVQPGTDGLTIVFVYAVSMTGDTAHVDREVVYPTANVTVLVAADQLDLRSDLLEFQGVRPFEGVDYRHYATHGVMPGTVLGLDFVAGQATTASIPTSSTSANASDTQATIRAIGLVLAGGALAFAVVYPLASRPRRRTRRS